MLVLIIFSPSVDLPHLEHRVPAADTPDFRPVSEDEGVRSLNHGGTRVIPSDKLITPAAHQHGFRLKDSLAEAELEAETLIVIVGVSRHMSKAVLPAVCQMDQLFFIVAGEDALRA